MSGCGEILARNLYRALFEVKNAREGNGKLLRWEELRHEMESGFDAENRSEQFSK